eukprot:gnl/TRDRNA2_/TRDRNA2_41840_c0_seq1.p1 gnl/TRDRNA2_/TRDRNA2_41840_c0~~gnl/TRDRNA2_/TRDRNA2_41840_c0_seq1.p1  ORF type:complete len:400 (+),score=118.75 gnl/TRDRNA2_/TRDRNA2_41840_c0_seq1:54-1202(+)
MHLADGVEAAPPDAEKEAALLDASQDVTKAAAREDTEVSSQQAVQEIDDFVGRSKMFLDAQQKKLEADMEASKVGPDPAEEPTEAENGDGDNDNANEISALLPRKAKSGNTADDDDDELVLYPAPAASDSILSSAQKEARRLQKLKEEERIHKMECEKELGEVQEDAPDRAVEQVPESETIEIPEKPAIPEETAAWNEIESFIGRQNSYLEAQQKKFEAEKRELEKQLASEQRDIDAKAAQRQSDDLASQAAHPMPYGEAEDVGAQGRESMLPQKPAVPEATASFDDIEGFIGSHNSSLEAQKKKFEAEKLEEQRQLAEAVQEQRELSGQAISSDDVSPQIDDAGASEMSDSNVGGKESEKKGLLADRRKDSKKDEGGCSVQ